MRSTGRTRPSRSASLHLTQGVGPNVGSWDQVSPRRGPLSYLEFVYPE